MSLHKKISPMKLSEGIAGEGSPPFIIDVREDSEITDGTVPGSVQITNADVFEVYSVAPDFNTPLVMVCSKGVKAGGIADRLAYAGYSDVSLLEGGTEAWSSAGLDLIKSDGDGEFRGGDPEYAQQKKEEKREEEEEELGKGWPTGKIDYGQMAKLHASEQKRHARDAKNHKDSWNLEGYAKATKASDSHGKAKDACLAAASDPGKESAVRSLSETAWSHGQRASTIDKAQAGEEAGEFRGGDPEDLQQKREEKRAEAIESGEMGGEEDEEEEEELDPDEVAEQEELEVEKEATKSYYSSINSGSSEVSPVDTWEDYKPHNINGDPVDEQPPIKPITPTAEARPGKNQHKPWSEVVGFEVPRQGEVWVDLRQYTMRGDVSGAEKKRAKYFKALNHGLTFDPGFYLAKAKKGEIIPGHKYIYRWLGKDGIWQYEYSGGTHVNHGPGEIGNSQGHTLEIPEGWVDQHDPEAKKGKGTKLKEAYEATIDHLEHHGGTFHVTKNGKPMIMVVQGHHGGKPKQKPIHFADPDKVREDQKIPEGEEFDPEKHKVKSKFKFPEHGGSWHRNFKALERDRTKTDLHTEVDAEGKPFLQWRFAGVEKEAKGKSRKKGSEVGRKIDARFVNPDHPLSELTAKEEKSGESGSWHREKFKDISTLREFVDKKKRQHAELMGLSKPSIPFKEVAGRDTVNWIHGGGIQKKVEHVPYREKGTWYPKVWESGGGQWIPGTGGESSRYKKKRATLVADMPSEELNRLTMKLHGELEPLIVGSANKVMAHINYMRKVRGRLPILGEEWMKITGENVRDDSVPVFLGLSKALHTYDPGNPNKERFEAYAYKKIQREQYRHAIDTIAKREAEAYEKMHPEGAPWARTEEDQPEKEPEPTGPQYEGTNEWILRTKEHLTRQIYATEDELEELEDAGAAEDDPERMVVAGKLKLMDHIKSELTKLEDDPLRIIDLIETLNAPTAFGPGFLPDLKVTLPEEAEPESEKKKTGPVVHRRKKEEDVEKAIAILRKAAHPTKLFQPVPEGVEAEDNPEYDPDPTAGKNWVNRYQDPETGSTRYSYLHEDRAGNPKLHHNNSMRYLDAQLPKIRAWYKERLASEQPMDRAVGLFLMLMDQAKIRHHDEVEGGLTTLKVGQVQDGEGNVTTLNFGDNYSVNVVMDEQSLAALQELMEGKGPDDPVFAVDGQPIDPEVVEKFLEDTFGVSTGGFRAMHATQQYSKEFQKLSEAPGDMEETKERALDGAAQSLGHKDGANSIRDHVDPVAQEALHMMAHSTVSKGLEDPKQVDRDLALTKEKLGEGKKHFAHSPANDLYRVAGDYVEEAKSKDKNNADHYEELNHASTQVDGGKTKASVHPEHYRKIAEHSHAMNLDYDKSSKRYGRAAQEAKYFSDGRRLGQAEYGHAYQSRLWAASRDRAIDLHNHALKKLPTDHKLALGAAREAEKHPPGSSTRGDAAIGLHQTGQHRHFPEIAKEVDIKPKTELAQQMQTVKSHVWRVSVDHPERTKEEELFGQWLHDYPIHEHESRWAKQKELDKDGHVQADPDHPGTGVEVKTHEEQVSKGLEDSEQVDRDLALTKEKLGEGKEHFSYAKYPGQLHSGAKAQVSESGSVEDQEHRGGLAQASENIEHRELGSAQHVHPEHYRKIAEHAHARYLAHVRRGDIHAGNSSPSDWVGPSDIANHRAMADWHDSMANEWRRDRDKACDFHNHALKKLPLEHKLALGAARDAEKHPPGYPSRGDAAIGLHRTGQHRHFPEIAKEVDIKPQSEQAKQMQTVTKCLDLLMAMVSEGQE